MLPLLSPALFLPLLLSAPAPDSLIIFHARRTYQYRAVYISPAGDTLSRETIVLQPSGQPWVGQPKRQKACAVQYHYSAADSLTFARRPHPQNEPGRPPETYDWRKSVITGVIENPTEVWMHPIRGNQYVYAEVAPFPAVQRAQLRPGGNWQGARLFIMSGWGAFRGSVKPTYAVEKQVTRQYGGRILPGCWQIHSVGQHSRRGSSFLDFYFHPHYGFTEMHYRFFDGTRISFVLERVE